MKMDQVLRALGIALGVQVLLAAITWWPRGDGLAEPRDLVPVDAEELAKITIYGRILRGEVHDEPLVLEREGEVWQIASAFDYPADPDMLSELFEALDKLKVRAPVATRAYSHQGLDVSDEEHSRKLELETDDGETIALYLGSAQGTAAHVRLVDEDEVYRVRGVSSYLTERATGYFDRDFQKVDVERVRSLVIERPGQAPITFAWDGATWTMPGRTPEGQVLDQAKARAFVRSAVNLRMLEPHGTQVTPEMQLDARGVTVSWVEEQDDGTSLAGEYHVGADIPDENGRVYLKSSTSPFVFEALKGQLQHAVEKGVDDLFTDPMPTPDAP